MLSGAKHLYRFVEGLKWRGRDASTSGRQMKHDVLLHKFLISN